MTSQKMVGVAVLHPEMVGVEEVGTRADHRRQDRQVALSAASCCVHVSSLLLIY